MSHTRWDTHMHVTCTHIYPEAHAHTHTHTLTSSSFVRNNFWTLDEFAVAGSLYLPVIAFLCPLSALPSKMFCASGSWRWLGKNQQDMLSASHVALPWVWQFMGRSVPYSSTRRRLYIICQTNMLHHPRVCSAGTGIYLTAPRVGQSGYELN